MSFITRLDCLTYATIVGSSYLFEKALSVPNLNPQLLLVGLIHDVVLDHLERLIFNICDRSHTNLSQNKAIEDRKYKLTSNVIFWPTCSLLPLFYQLVMRRLGIEFPSYAITLTFLTLMGRARKIVPSLAELVFPQLADGKPHPKYD